MSVSKPLARSFSLAFAVLLALAVGCNETPPDEARLGDTGPATDTAPADTMADTTAPDTTQDTTPTCDCGDDETCVEGQCLSTLGVDCQSDDGCASGTCGEIAGTQICTRSCTATCAADGMTCYQGQCVPEDFCADQDGDLYGAGPGCKDTDCDEESADVHAGATEICNGVDDDCNGRVDDAPECECQPGNTRDCYEGDPATRNRGICETGTQTCQDDYTWGACEGQTLPGAEICDTKDNDCDGATDENGRCACNPGETRDCYSGPTGTKDRGQCSSGTQTCRTDHTWGTCQNQVLPSNEVCDTKDNDCDGSTDEDFNLQTDPNHCGSCGNDCNVPNAVAACTGGSCAIDRCHQNHWNNDEKIANGCEYQCVSRGPEACNDKDDDCDGVVDNGYGVGRTCSGTGACGQGKIECLTPQTTVCSTDPQGSNPQTNPETCDSVDNDCDGQTDETYTSLGMTCTSGTGQCERKGVLVCASGNNTTTCGATPGKPSPETCDGLDNDCDGQTDEDCSLAQTSWPTYKANTRRTAHTMQAQGPNSAKVLWTKSLGNVPRSSPVIGPKGRIYTGGDRLYAFEKAGKQQWAANLGGSVGQPTVVSDGSILAGAGNKLYNVTPAGKVRWSYTANAQAGDPLIADDGTIYLTAANKLHALKPDGTKKWVFSGGGGLHPPAIGLSDRVYVSASSAILYGVNPNGSLYREYARPGSDTDGGPTVGQDGTVYTPFSSIVHAMDRTLQKVRWTYNTGGDIDSSISIMNTGFQCCNPIDYPYVSANGNTGLQKLDFRGNQSWSYPMNKDGGGNGAPIFDTDGDAYVGDSSGTYYAIDRGGSLKWKLSLSGGDVWAGAIAKNRLYVISGSTLYAIGPTP